MNMQQGRQQTERGMVSILVTMIMMIVITLIVIGISQVTRSNKREQLDQQLSSQAYYAAESGLNQATKFFAANPTASLNTTGNCTQFITGAAPNGLQGTVGTSNVLNPATKVSYTCLMVNSTPPTLQKAPLTEDSNTVWHVRNASGANLTQLEFKWKSNSKTQFTATPPTNCTPANANCCANVTTFPAYGSWKCAFGILRVDLVDTHGTVSTGNGTGFESPAKTIYIAPTYTVSGVTTPQAITSSVGQVIYVQCSTSLCSVKLNTTGVSNDYYARLTMIYQDSDSVTLSGSDASGAVTFSGGQAVIDVTGKAQDQLRRVQARIPLTISGSPIPVFALQSTDTLCKQMGTAPGINTVDSCP